ncbi:glycoside hydrolase family 11 protein [[Clostridium] polysaccharolyticum]|uniref:Endo-1,4-beta-xylanase n=1 Tax=[Clostridium] polysaccharolyticum TaxID=29364 RepID=A0A1H9YUR4_9FIRM|nr:glycoside hydrolase family 11 protein [[Clostridium] polysaccharolyticum]SES72923.1 endo-1,4-beta-xylanase [[Clostridium] polysaccharolyticum]
MKKKILGICAAALLSLSTVFTGPVTVDTTIQAATVLYNNSTGTQDGYNYELWKDYGTTSMTLNGGGAFDCSWSNIGNALFRKGKKFDSTKTYQQLGNISIDYGCDYRPNGNSYLCVYGWSKNPLVEYYIVESWGTWRPPGASSKGTISVDGGTYDVYETTRVNQPSIEGNTTFKQFWSVRTSKKTSGTISVTEHFKAWERMGMRLGNIYEAALNVEGYQSSGSANVYKNNMTIGGSVSNNNQGNQGYQGNQGNQGNQGYQGGSSSNNSKECESMTKGGQYTGNINSPFSGVALYANNDSVTFNQYFANGTHNFTLRGCSNNNNMARVDLYIGNQYKGTFYYGGSYPAEYTINNVSHGTGNQEVKLVVTADDGQWDAFIDYLKW